MAKGMTKTALVRHMAEKLEITNKQAAAGLELLAETAVKETKKNGEFTIPGIGKLVKAERKARLGRNPQTGETDQDQGQDRGQVPRRQGRQGHHRTGQEVARSLPGRQVSRRAGAGLQARRCSGGSTEHGRAQLFLVIALSR